MVEEFEKKFAGFCGTKYCVGVGSGTDAIMTGLHYPLPLHLQRSYASLGFKPGSFPVSERAALEILSLPMWPGLQRIQQEKIADCIREFFVTFGIRTSSRSSLPVGRAF